MKVDTSCTLPGYIYNNIRDLKKWRSLNKGSVIGSLFYRFFFVKYYEKRFAHCAFVSETFSLWAMVVFGCFWQITKHCYNSFKHCIKYVILKVVVFEYNMWGTVLGTFNINNNCKMYQQSKTGQSTTLLLKFIYFIQLSKTS